MKNIKLTVEYDGAEFKGYQTQPGLRTIQGELETALTFLTGESIRIAAAGRTDAGVHARGQIVSFHTTSGLPVETFEKGMNFYLPDDIAVTNASIAPEGFHARRSAKSREYRYVVLNRKNPSPLWRRFAYHYPYALNLSIMAEGASILVGEHDFAAFAGSEALVKGHTRRRIVKAAVSLEEELVCFCVEANAFLPYQVRTMMGTLLWVGIGKLSVTDFATILDSKDRKVAGPTAPAHGLYFMKANYE